MALLQIIIIGQGNSLGPSFAQPRYHAVVSENEAVGTTVITVTVTDYDQVQEISLTLSINYNTFNIYV